MNNIVEDEIWSLFPEVKERRVELLDELYYTNLLKRKKVYIWGTGKSMIKLMTDIPCLEVAGFIDNNRENRNIELNGKDYEVLSPEQICGNDIFIIVASQWYDDIKKQLVDSGYYEYLDFIHWFRMYPRPQELVKTIVDSKKVTNWKCVDAVSRIRLETNGDVNCCRCPNWTHFSTGNAFLQSKEEIMNSVIARLFFYSIDSGRYCFCNSNKCTELDSKINNFTVNNESCEFVLNKDGEIAKVALASMDESCNLYCESCRKERYYSEDKVKEFLKNYFIREILPDCDIVNCAGQGEVFLSKYYQEILNNCKKEQAIIVLSNGILATKNKIKALSEKTNNLEIVISIDAATEETYRRVRRGGDFERLMSNLNDIGELLKCNKIKAFVLTFVVSKKNYKEMAEFVALAKKVGASAVNFTRLYNWGTFSDEEFSEISLFDKNNKPNRMLEQEINKIKDEDDIKVFVFDRFNSRNYYYQILGESRKNR